MCPRQTKERPRSSTSIPKFEVDEGAVFGRFDLLTKRCRKLSAMFSTIEQFSVLSEVGRLHLSGPAAVSSLSGSAVHGCLLECTAGPALQRLRLHSASQVARHLAPLLAVMPEATDILHDLHILAHRPDPFHGPTCFHLQAADQHPTSMR